MALLKGSLKLLRDHNVELEDAANTPQARAEKLKESKSLMKSFELLDQPDVKLLTSSLSCKISQQILLFVSAYLWS